MMMVSTAVLNLAMVFYHRQMSVHLGVAYGDLAALTGLVNIVVVVASGVATWLTRVFAHDSALNGEAAALLRLRSLAPRLLVALSALVGLMLAAAWPITVYLRLGAWQSYAFAAVTVLAGLVMMTARSLLQGVHRFGVLSASYLLEAFGRATVPPLLAAAFGVAGALAGTALVALFASLAVLPLLWRHREAPPLGEGDGGDTRGLVRDTMVMGLFSMLCYVDILLFKHAHGGQDEALVALYSRGALVGKSFLYVAAAFTLVALPSFSASAARGEDSRPLLGRFLLVMAGVQVAGLALLLAFTPLALRVLLGNLPDLGAIAPVARGMALAVVPLALFQLVMLHGLATHWRGLLPLMGAAVAVYGAALRWWADSALTYVACLGIVSTLLLVGGLALALRPQTEGV